MPKLKYHNVDVRIPLHREAFGHPWANLTLTDSSQFTLGGVEAVSDVVCCSGSLSILLPQQAELLSLVIAAETRIKSNMLPVHFLFW